MAPPKVKAAIEQALDRLVGLECWYVSAGAVGTTFELALGDRVPRSVPLKNPDHSAEFRQFEGEANLLVWCTWRLDGSEAPLSSSDDVPERVVAELGRLVGAKVANARVDGPAWDLSLDFSNGLCLRVFADHVPGEPSFDGNWELVLEQTAVYAGPGVRVEIEPRRLAAVGRE